MLLLTIAPTLTSDIHELINRAKKELPGEFVAYPIGSGLSPEEFRNSLLKRLEDAKNQRSNE